MEREVRLTALIDDLRTAPRGLDSNCLKRSDLGLLGRKSDGSSAVPEHPQSQVRTIQSGLLRMKPAGASVSARIVGLESLPVKSGTARDVPPLRIDESVLGIANCGLQSMSHQMRDQMPVSPPADSEDSKSAIGNLPAATARMRRMKSSRPASRCSPSNRQGSGS